MRKIIIKFAYLLVGVCLLLASCEKEDSTYTCVEEMLTMKVMFI